MKSKINEGGYPNQRLRAQWVDAIEQVSTVDELGDIIYNHITPEQMQDIINDINENFSVNYDNALDYGDEMYESKTVKLSETDFTKMIENAVRRIIKESMSDSNLVKQGHRIYFRGEKCWYMVPNRDGEFDVYDDGEYEGKYCGSLQHLESLPNGSAALDDVISGL